MKTAGKPRSRAGDDLTRREVVDSRTKQEYELAF